jgi:hypothetical protein
MEVHYHYFVYVFSLISIYVIMNYEFRSTYTTAVAACFKS